jgi:hypothetical protein
MSETISCPLTFTKDGVFYFSRRIPKELKHHYSLGSHIRYAPNHLRSLNRGPEKLPNSSTSTGLLY